MLRLMLPLVLPDHVPVYVTTPTAPKLIELPVRVPLICRVSRGDVSWISPWSAEPLSFHWSTNVPLKGPLYCPVQFPDRSTIGVGVGAGMGVGVAVAVAVAAGVGVPLVVDALHPPSPIAARARTRARNLLRNIDLASSWVTGKVCSRGAPLSEPTGSCTRFTVFRPQQRQARSRARPTHGGNVVARRCSLVAFEHPRSRQTL